MRTAATSQGSGKLSQTIKIGAHELVTDASIEEGGNDLGASPHELLAAALSACTSITLKMYAQRKNWPLQNANVSVAIDKVGETSVFKREVHLVGISDAEQMNRLLEIANRCPVHRVLAGKIEITTALK